jgi:hypothetical protein
MRVLFVAHRFGTAPSWSIIGSEYMATVGGTRAGTLTSWIDVPGYLLTACVATLIRSFILRECLRLQLHNVPLSGFIPQLFPEDVRRGSSAWWMAGNITAVASLLCHRTVVRVRFLLLGNYTWPNDSVRPTTKAISATMYWHL